MPFAIDESRWPHAVLTIDDKLTPAEQDAFVAQSTELILRGERFAAILDLRDSGTPPSRFLRLQARALNDHHDQLRAHCVGLAFVMRSAMLRGALKAILHLAPLPSPYVIVDTLDEAESWVSDALPQPQSSN